MTARRITYTTSGSGTAVLAGRFATIRAQLGVAIAFPEDVLAEARAAAAAPQASLADQTDVRFVTIDPPGSMDLDQAMCIERDGAGYRVRYAIADVPAFVVADGAMDAEARRRGQTVYCPDERAPLHPPVLSEAAASLLPDTVRPAFVWDIHLAADGGVAGVAVTRALVRSHARLDYAGVAQLIATGAAGAWPLELLREVGELRAERERARGGASLPMPEQEVTELGDGTYELAYRPLLPSEDWNAQISLLTGMVAADLMRSAGVGILRTMPAPDERTMTRFRRQVAALGVSWPADQSYGELLRSLDRANPTHLALIHEAAGLFRGAAYQAFDGAVPADETHAALAAPYAHVTAPLRRLVDRFGLAVCEAVANRRPVPDWARAALPTLPEIMARTDRTASAVQRACVDAVEAALLHDHVGQVFDGVVIDDADATSVIVQVTEPAIVAKAAGEGSPGDQVRVIVSAADIAAGTIALQVVPAAG